MNKLRQLVQRIIKEETKKPSIADKRKIKQLAQQTYELLLRYQGEMRNQNNGSSSSRSYSRADEIERQYEDFKKKSKEQAVSLNLEQYFNDLLIQFRFGK